MKDKIPDEMAVEACVCDSQLSRLRTQKLTMSHSTVFKPSAGRDPKETANCVLVVTLVLGGGLSVHVTVVHELVFFLSLINVKMLPIMAQTARVWELTSVSLQGLIKFTDSDWSSWGS